MMNYDTNDTIAAISTPIGESGIGIVRISGKEALSIADRIFLPKDGRKPSSSKAYTTHYGWIVESHAQKDVNARRYSRHSAQRNIIDEVILTVMRAPRSYTKEDVVEINCHGGIAAMRMVLDLVLGKGARLSEPGEFTKRAFLNGRIDLAQAEAVLDIIRAKTDSALKVGVGQLRGALSGQINKAREVLLDALCVLEAGIDFPEEEIGRLDSKNTIGKLNSANERLQSILGSAKIGRIFREGISVVICGRPNVGKSSLLNALLREERSIVTPIAGTTRDTVEEVINIKGIPVRIIDTAGIIEPRDLIERKAVQRSKGYIDLADLVILLFDGSARLTKDDEALIKKLGSKASLAVINKIDLRQRIQRKKIAKRFVYIVDISAKKSKNINLLEDAIADIVYNGQVMAPEPVLISNLRHIEKIRGAQKLIAQAVNSLDNKLSPELASQDIKDALLYLDDILGKRFSEDLLNRIFSEFCIGK